MSISPGMWWGTEIECVDRGKLTRSERSHDSTPHHAGATLLSVMDRAGYEPVTDDHLIRYYPHPPEPFSAFAIAASSNSPLIQIRDLLCDISLLPATPRLVGAIIIGPPDTPLGALRHDGSISLAFREPLRWSASEVGGPPLVINDDLRHSCSLAMDRRESYQLERHLWFSLPHVENASASSLEPGLGTSSRLSPAPKLGATPALSPAVSLSEFIDLPLGSRLSHLLRIRQITTGESLLRVNLGVLSVRWRELEITAHHDRIIKKELILYRRYAATDPRSRLSRTTENTSPLTI